MKSKVFLKNFHKLVKAFPVHNRIDEDTTDVYYEALHDCPDTVFPHVVARAIKTEQFFPVPARLRELWFELSPPEWATPDFEAERRREERDNQEWNRATLEIRQLPRSAQDRLRVRAEQIVTESAGELADHIKESLKIFFDGAVECEMIRLFQGGMR